MKHHILRSAAAYLLCAGLLAGCGSTASAAPTATTGKALKIGVRTSVVNFGYQDPDSGRFYGLGVDIGAEIASRLGYTAEYVAVTSADREEKLQNGEADCIVAAYTITPDRQEKFDFSPAYYHDTVRVIAADSTEFKSITDLRDHTIGVLQNTNTAAEVAAEMNLLGLLTGYNAATFETATFNGGVSFKPFGSYADVIAAMECGEVDAAAMDGSIAQAYMTSGRHYLQESFGSEAYGVATIKGSPLSAEVATAVQAMLDDGTIDRLVGQWN